MIKGPHKESYEDPIFQILSFYVIRFDLQTLLKLTENIEEKNPKMSKNSHQQVNNLNFKKQKNAFLGIIARVPHIKNQLPTSKTVTCRADTDRQTDRQRK